MNTAGVLDDYLEQLLGDAMPAPAEVEAQAPLPVAAADPVEVTVTAAAPATEEVIPPGFDDLLDELRNDPLLSGAMTLSAAPAVVEAAAETDAAIAALPVAAPGFDDLLDELRNDPLLSGAMPAPADEARPSWDDLPPEVVHETGPVAAIAPPVAAPAPVVAPTPAPAPAPAPAAVPVAPAARAPAVRSMPAMAPMLAATSARANAPSLAQSRPGSWEELQRQARDPASSPRENRRAAERTSRWLRLRCGAQAYALELLKVQEVVLPVPLLPLRGTSPAMLGIMNLRGQVVPVMDLGIHLGSSAAGNDANTRIVVLEENGETMGLRVSAVEDVANLTDSQIEPPDTARICQISNDLFRGVARGGAQPMILLDATQLLN
ncbi:chemotaxis protein CheW [Stenotrophomonas sp. SAM-B]|uniref:chemotaxis protein CheW n=1 Tax=Stenotrophomonas sp. SAM-B TaxID=2729141 RepID=UPI0015A1F819|nr:chemotaxis protein CheW [Stenotrophomonas sp. SAM-B]NWF32861.1 chemotaxis protein CheW [Stenotrophomonas sp. SAM-B]